MRFPAALAQLPWLYLICCCFCLGTCLASDIEALMELKKGFDDSEELATWNASSSGAPCIGWKGITCTTNTQDVEAISLSQVLKGGSISDSIGDLSHLQTLDLSANELEGPIPSRIGNLKDLTSINLSGNKLSGNIPSHWSNLTNLGTLILAGNELQGPIPSSISQAKSLQKLRLENNSLTGEIPEEIFLDLKGLTYFAIEYNDIGGPIPDSIGNCTSLRSWYAAYNKLNGSLPDSIGNLTRLRHFEANNNELSGPIPQSLANLSDSLITLDLSYNSLSGPIPSSLTGFHFEENDDLCGQPGLSACPSPTPPPPSYPRMAYPPPWSDPSSSSRRGQGNRSSSSKGKIIGAVVGGVVGASALLLLILFLLRRQSKKSGDQAQVQNWFSPDIQSNRKRGTFVMYSRNFKYTYEEIVSNAGFYDTAHVLGKGRFATVFKSFFPDGTQLAVKVFKYASLPGNFEKEVELLASIKHPNLLMIRGFYSNSVENAIFYDYLPTGTLYNMLHGDSVGSSPDWAARQQIALGVAQALAYLHRGCGHKILHRDVKSTNILLEADLLPRVCDYGLVQLASGRPQDVVETHGYTAPEVLINKKYTEKSDVYSFGVVLLELLTGNKPVSYIRERSVTLTNWVTRLHKEKRGREVYDPIALKTCPLPEYLERALNLAVLCVDENPSIRPTMSEIASILEGLSSAPSPLRSPEFRFDRPLLSS